VRFEILCFSKRIVFYLFEKKSNWIYVRLFFLTNLIRAFKGSPGIKTHSNSNDEMFEPWILLAAIKD
jgi:hypothetical protein